ncbi:hypothetical protein D9M68_627800 [compost metagenome]
MQDVFGQVVLAGGDEDLAAADGVAAIGLGVVAGAQQAEVGTAMGLGQAHGAAPAALDQRRQEALLECLLGMLAEGADGAAAEVAVHGPGMVGAEQQLADHAAQGWRQALAAVGRVLVQGQPTIGGELTIGLGEAGRGADLVVLPLAAMLVAHRVERRQHVLGELRAFLDYGVQGLALERLATLQLLVMAGQIEELVDDEADVTLRSLIDGHGAILESAKACPDC